MISLRERIKKDLEYVFEPIFSHEDDTLAYFCPIEGEGKSGTLVFKVDIWCNYSYKKYIQLKEFFAKYGLPFVTLDRFLILSLSRTFNHESIHSAELLDVSEEQIDYIVNKIFTDGIFDAIIDEVTELLKKRIHRVIDEELLASMRSGVETLLRETKTRRKNRRVRKN